MEIENIFCRRCHKLAAQIRRNEDKVEVRQGGRVLLSLSAKSSGNKIGVSCPSCKKSIKLNI